MKDLSRSLGSVDSSEESVTGAGTNILKLRQNEEISMIGDGYVSSAAVCLMVKTNQKPRGSKKWFLVIYDCYYGTVICLSSPGTPIAHMLVSRMVSHRSLRRRSFFFIFNFCSSD